MAPRVFFACAVLVLFLFDGAIGRDDIVRDTSAPSATGTPHVDECEACVASAFAVLDALDAVVKRRYASRGDQTDPPPADSDAAKAFVEDAGQRACAQRAYWNSYSMKVARNDTRLFGPGLDSITASDDDRGTLSADVEGVSGLGASLRGSCASLLERLGPKYVMDTYISVGPTNRTQKVPGARTAQFQRRFCTQSPEVEDDATTTAPCNKQLFDERSAAAKKATEEAAAEADEFKRKDTSTGQTISLGSDKTFDEAHPLCTVPRTSADKEDSEEARRKCAAVARHAFEQGRENEKLAHEAQGIIHQMGSGENASSVLQAKLEQLVEQKKRQALAMFSVAEGAARTPEMRAAAAAALSRIQVWMVQSNATAAVSNSSSSLSPESRQPTLEVAVESARRAARALPFAHEAHAALGNALYHAEDRPGAMLAYEEAVSLMPLTDERRAEALARLTEMRIHRATEVANPLLGTNDFDAAFNLVQKAKESSKELHVLSPGTDAHVLAATTMILADACKKDVSTQAAMIVFPNALAFMRYCRSERPPQLCADTMAMLAEQLVDKDKLYALAAAVAVKTLSFAPSHADATAALEKAILNSEQQAEDDKKEEEGSSTITSGTSGASSSSGGKVADSGGGGGEKGAAKDKLRDELR